MKVFSLNSRHQKVISRCIDVINNTGLLLDTHLYSDSYGNEYVLLSVPQFSVSDPVIQDRTAFEALNTHTHVLSDLSKRDFKDLRVIAPHICRQLLTYLNGKYPGKHFCVFASAVLHDDFIIRFHQKWENETPYYDVHEGKKEWVVLEES
ncbi:MAG: hypothetical protein IKP40_05605 [Clostridia bacterium]|nr:hypothetical protein [Clostridia bacterium]